MNFSKNLKFSVLLLVVCSAILEMGFPITTAYYISGETKVSKHIMVLLVVYGLVSLLFARISYIALFKSAFKVVDTYVTDLATINVRKVESSPSNYFSVVYNETVRLATNYISQVYLLIAKCIVVGGLIVFSAIMWPGITLLSVSLLTCLIITIVLLLRSPVRIIGKSLTDLNEKRIALLQILANKYTQLTINNEMHSVSKEHEKLSIQYGEVFGKNQFLQNMPRGILEISIIVMITLSSSWAVEIDILSLGVVAMKLIPGLQNVYAIYNKMSVNRDSLSVIEGKLVEAKSIHGHFKPEEVFRGDSTCEHLTVYCEFKYLDKSLCISQEVLQGSYQVWSGPSGSGKSTMMKVLAGVYNAHNGVEKLLINQERYKGVDLNSVYYLGQGEFTGDITQKTILSDDILAGCCIDFDYLKDYHSISGGQYQRLRLALALSKLPKYLFLDESLSGIDPNTKYLIRAFLEKFALAYEVTIIEISHG